MPRPLRVNNGNEIYHCLNRGVGKQTIFHNNSDYKLFEKILQEVVDITDMRILAYALMPNHFHLVLHPQNDGDLSEFRDKGSDTFVL